LLLLSVALATAQDTERIEGSTTHALSAFLSISRRAWYALPRRPVSVQ
jgi:hypothetical protein